MHHIQFLAIKIGSTEIRYYMAAIEWNLVSLLPIIRKIGSTEIRFYMAARSVTHILHNPGLCIICVSEYVENVLCIMSA